MIYGEHRYDRVMTRSDDDPGDDDVQVMYGSGTMYDKSSMTVSTDSGCTVIG